MRNRARTIAAAALLAWGIAAQAQNAPKYNPAPTPRTQAQALPKQDSSRPGQALGKEPAASGSGGQREWTVGPVSGPEAPVVTPVRVPTAILEQPVTRRTSYSTDHALWTCEGRRCEAPRLDLRDFYVACGPLAQRVGTVVSFQSVELSLNAAELERCNSPLVVGFYVMACSGADDLRENSALKMAWQSDGRRFAPSDVRWPLFTEIPSGECESITFGLPPLHRFPLTDLRMLHFRFEGGRNAPTDSVDDWDMRLLFVSARVVRPGGGAQLFTPLIRIETAARFEDVRTWSNFVPREATRPRL